jgi:hypothetical protein
MTRTGKLRMTILSLCLLAPACHRAPKASVKPDDCFFIAGKQAGKLSHKTRFTTVGGTKIKLTLTGDGSGSIVEFAPAITTSMATGTPSIIPSGEQRFAVATLQGGHTHIALNGDGGAQLDMISGMCAAGAS